MMIFVLGFLFAAILQYARLNRYNVISALALWDDLAVIKAIALTIGVGSILLNIEIHMGLAGYHIKPLLVTGVILGGLVFGSGMAILGYCPGTLAISLGEGSLDALLGIIGGLAGAWLFTVLFPWLHPYLGPDYGKVYLSGLIANNLLFYLVILVVGVLFTALAFLLHKKDPSEHKDYKWLVSGIGLAVLNSAVFLKSLANRPIGASTSFPYVASKLAHIANSYAQKVAKPGYWELVFLSGAFTAGVVVSLVRKDFGIRLIHNNWRKIKGNSAIKRAIWALIGGFLLIIGARLAGGCTSGHIISGGMQLSVSSLVFALFVFIGLLVTGKLFYRQK